MIHVRGIAARGLLVSAIWLVFGIPISAAARQHREDADFPNGDPCAGQELTLKIDGQKGSPILSYGPITIRGVLHCGTVPIRDASIAVAEVGGVPGAPLSHRRSRRGSTAHSRMWFRRGRIAWSASATSPTAAIRGRR